MAARRLLAVVAFAACIYAAAAINGGIGCRYFSTQEIITTMQANSKTADQIATAINSTRYVNGYLCRSCVSPRMQEKNTGMVKDGYSECWCASGYGWSQRVIRNNKTGVSTFYNKYLCTKCPESAKWNYTGGSNPSTGPYLPAPTALRAGTGNRWTQTGCTRGQPAPPPPGPPGPPKKAIVPSAPAAPAHKTAAAIVNKPIASGKATTPK